MFVFKFVISNYTGEMAEWSMAHAWKVCMLQKGIMGSNPILSAAILRATWFYALLSARLA